MRTAVPAAAGRASPSRRRRRDGGRGPADGRVAGSLCGRVPDRGRNGRLVTRSKRRPSRGWTGWSAWRSRLADGGSGEVLDSHRRRLPAGGRPRGVRPWWRLLAGTSCLCAAAGRASPLERAARRLRELGAGVCETSAHAYLALAAHLAGDWSWLPGRPSTPRTAGRPPRGSRRGRGGRPGAGPAVRRRPASWREPGSCSNRSGTWDWHRRLGSGRPAGLDGAAAGSPVGDGRRRRRPRRWSSAAAGQARRRPSGPGAGPCGCAASAASRS